MEADFIIELNISDFAISYIQFITLKKSMGIIIKTTRQIIPRIVIGLLLILLLAFSPFIISITGVWITESITNEPCHEGNCFWGVVGWLFFITFPLSALLLIIFTVVIIIDILGLKKVKTFGNSV